MENKKDNNIPEFCGLADFQRSPHFQKFNDRYKVNQEREIQNLEKSAQLLDQYIPNSNTELKILCLNFHIFQDDFGNGNFSFEHIPELKSIVNWANSTFESPRTSSNSIFSHDVISINDARIRFKINKIEFYRNSNLLDSTDTSALFDEIISRDIGFLKQINVFFTEGTLANNPKASGFANFPSQNNMNLDSHVVLLRSYLKYPGGIYSKSQTLAHELGHVLDLRHTYFGGGGDANCNISNPEYLHDVFGKDSSTCPHINIWSADAFDNNLPQANKITNNLMGGNQSNKWISPLQAAMMHRALETKSVSKYLVNNCECINCVAFHANGSKHISVGGDQILNYSITSLNEGWCWDGCEFTAPVYGVYQFAVTFVKDAFYHEGTTDDVKITLKRNGKSQGNAWSGQGSGKRGSGFYSINIKLDRGDKIHTEIHSDLGKKRHIAQFSFSGNLICKCI